MGIISLLVENFQNCVVSGPGYEDALRLFSEKKNNKKNAIAQVAAKFKWHFDPFAIPLKREVS